MIKKLVAIFMLWSVTLGAVFAKEQKLAPPDGYVFVYHLADMVQTPKETRQQFLVRVSQFMQRYTDETNFESCAAVCRSPEDLLGVTIYTDRSQISCSSITRCAEGFVGQGEDIHTHPPAGKITLNEADSANFNRRTGRKIFKVRSGGKLRVAPNRFSSEDYATGAGYMIYKNNVWYQNGRGTEKWVFAVPAYKSNKNSPDPKN